MEDVTDAAFRALIAKYSDPDIPRVFYTEFTSADGLVFADEHGRTRLDAKLSFTPAERPIVAQLFTASAERMELAAHMAAQRGFDGVDINMGCPDRSVEKSGCGAAMIKNPPLAREIIRAAKHGAAGLPISIKTRIGYSKESELEVWLGELLAERPAALAVHLRTRQEMSEVPAHWEWVPRIVALRDSISPETRIIGNGDVRDIADAREKAAHPLRHPPAGGADGGGCDGVMLGRAVFGNPWLFSSRRRLPEVGRGMRIKMLIEHIALFKEKLSGIVSEAVMKRHFKAYISGWPGAAELRARLMEAPDLDAAAHILIASAQ